MTALKKLEGYLYLTFKGLSSLPFCSWFSLSFLLSIPCFLLFPIDFLAFQNIHFLPLPISVLHSYNSLFHFYSGIILFFFHSPLPPSLAFYTICFLNLSLLSHVSPLYCSGTSRSFKSEWWRFGHIWNKHECYKHKAMASLWDTQLHGEKGISNSGLKGVQRRLQDPRRKKLATWQDILEFLYEELEG